MDNKFIRVDEVAQELSVSKPYAYKLIKKLNDELNEQGFITIAGRVNRQYFQERFYCNAALCSRRKKHFIFDSINTITAPSFR